MPFNPVPEGGWSPLGSIPRSFFMCLTRARLLAGLTASFCSLWTLSLQAADSVAQPRPIPLTRPAMKTLLEDLKARKPRIPLPALSEDEKQKAGSRTDNYESRLREYYLPQANGQRGGFARGADSKMSLDYPFKTMMFWIVSRTNNCQYCLGHQEIKLSVAGLDEDKIAALDGDWRQFTPAEQSAFAFARRLTYEPHRLGDADIEGLRKHYSELQILEIVLSVAGNNSINRWKEGVGVPQEQTGRGFLRRGGAAASAGKVLPIESFLTPTADEYKKLISKVAPLHRDEATGEATGLTVCRRPPLETRAEVERQLALCRKRLPRLTVLSEDDAREAFGDQAEKDTAAQWVRLLANFPREGASRMRGLRSAEQTGDLSATLKAQVSWIVARQDRAWYATAESIERLKKLGQTDDQVYSLDGSRESFSPAERSLFTVAGKLAASPIVLTDQDVDEAVQQTSARDVVQLINYVTGRAYFNRVTEAAGLPADQ
jgi:alkylhydroperoxidase family enzyme